jgi:GNAT superfamily N-acetyltransferase
MVAVAVAVSPEEPAGTIEGERAHLDDAPALHALRIQVENWLAGKGLVQWGQGRVPLETIRSQIDQGLWWLHRDGDQIKAAMLVLEADPDFWGAAGEDGSAIYVHSLMVDRSAAGQGLGTRILEWAARHGRSLGKDVFRLDCAEHHWRLRAFYRSQGFIEVGRHELPGVFACTLMEKSLNSACATLK